MACSPASNTRNTKGVHCHTSTAITESSASRGAAVHVRLSVFTPNCFSVPLIAPKPGLNNKRQTKPEQEFKRQSHDRVDECVDHRGAKEIVGGESFEVR